MEEFDEKEPMFYYVVKGVKFYTPNIEFAQSRSLVYGEEN